MPEASSGAGEANEARLVDLFPADAAAWTSETPLRAEYARLMRGFHRPIPWEESHAPRLDPALRAELARIWGERIPTEYRSITGFSTLSFDFIAAGAPVDLVAVCHRVCIDELRHTELAVKMVELYGGHLPPLPREIVAAGRRVADRGRAGVSLGDPALVPGGDLRLHRARDAARPRD